MLKRLFKFVILVLMLIGIFLGISITVNKKMPSRKKKEAENKIVNMVQSRTAELESFYTYGRAFHIKGKVKNISKDNFESARLVITDGLDYEKNYNLECGFEENDLAFYSSDKINSGIIIDELENKEYYVCLRLKLNNSVNPKYYSFKNNSGCEELSYYTITNDGVNRLAKISFVEKKSSDINSNILTIKLEDSTIPEDVYDIVIDAGNGGKDPGEVSGATKEADINLEYSKALKTSLEEKGYKVKLTRDDENTANYTYNNMYDENGRISIACKSKAKLMISFQVNNGAKNLSGFEVYAPCKCDMSLAVLLAQKIKEYSSISYSNNGAYKYQDGVYVKNYTAKEIKEAEYAAKRKGYEPYNITEQTPYFYTIREVGGIATNAYVDGRNKDYSKNEYYRTNQGIECYQIELGYIKTDLEIIKNEKEKYIRAISEAIDTKVKDLDKD